MNVDPVIIGAYLAALVVCYWAGFQFGKTTKLISGIGKGS